MQKQPWPYVYRSISNSEIFQINAAKKKYGSGLTQLFIATGLSVLHILILVFCLIALLLTIGFCGPVFNLLRKKGIFFFLIFLRKKKWSFPNRSRNIKLFFLSQLPPKRAWKYTFPWLSVRTSACLLPSACGQQKVETGSFSQFLTDITSIWSAQCQEMTLIWVFCFVSVLVGFISEAVTCSALSIMRIIMLMKTSPYLNRLPGTCFDQFGEPNLFFLYFNFYFIPDIYSMYTVFV